MCTRASDHPVRIDGILMLKPTGSARSFANGGIRMRPGRNRRAEETMRKKASFLRLILRDQVQFLSYPDHAFYGKHVVFDHTRNQIRLADLAVARGNKFCP